MTSEYQQLEWQQNGLDITITLPTPTMVINFPLDKALINHLVANSPKVVLLHVDLAGQEEQIYIIDFDELKTVPSSESFLSVKMGAKYKSENIESSFTPLGKYCISRGESHYNKHISEMGWQRQRKYFNIYNVQEVEFKTKLHQAELHKAKEQQKVKAAEVKKEQTPPKSKLKQCSNCGEVIPNLPACPYCGTKQ